MWWWMLWLGCAEPVVDEGPVLCEIAHDDGCPRRLVCCVDAVECWVEVGSETIDCEPDSCRDALDLACQAGGSGSID